MSSEFRLARLLRLRAEEARIKKLEWALEVRTLVAARERRREAEDARDGARRESAEARATLGRRSGRSLLATVAEELPLEAFGVAIEAADHAARGAAAKERDAHGEFEAAEQRVRALERLETKWRHAETRRRRRREARAIDEINAVRAAANLWRTAGESEPRTI